MVKSQASVMEEVNEIREQMDLYIKSNPDWDKKKAAITEEDVDAARKEAVVKAASFVAQVQAVAGLDSNCLDMKDEERASFEMIKAVV